MRIAKWAMIVGLSATVAGCGVLGGRDKPKVTPTVGDRTAILSRAESSAAVDPDLAGVAVILPAAVTNTNWSQPGGSATKAVGHMTIGTSPVRAWTAKIAGSTTRVRLAAAPVVFGGRLYAVDTDGMVHAFDAASGQKVWSAALEARDDGKNSVFGGGVSADATRVFATNGVGEVAALNAADGAQLWRVKPAGPLRGAPTLAFGAAYVMSQDNQLIALNQNDGTIIWNESGSLGQAGVFGVAAPAAGQGTVVAGFSSGELIAYRYENGRNLWSDALARTSISTSVSTLTDIDADPIIDRGRVYAVGEGGRMAAYELVSGQRIWELNIAGISTPTIAGEWLFVLTHDARILCIARATGKVRWSTQLQRYRKEKKKEGQVDWTGPVLGSGRLFIANTQGELGTVNPSDGVFTMLHDLKQPVSLPPIIADNTLYVLDDSGTITAFR
ncbi:PQQ-binding-like beta-propeller repeat protein [Blastomonas sp.]|uniref:outer membrane protein assembly factor BamB family protein n=1 Tax=Blastomonas sp. TaxID=1909299 RepID=UPI0035935344